MGLIDDFPGFPPEAMPFLRDLAANNDRDWFKDHRDVYEAAIRLPGEGFVAAIRPWLENLAGTPLNAKVFRLHRDVRFSKDKSPYNAHLHIGFSSDAGPGFYVGLEPERLVLGAGLFETSGPTLDAFRAAIDDPVSGPDLAEVAEALTRSGFRIEGAALKRTPAPYAADHPRAELLRRKGLTAWRETSDTGLITSPALMGFCEDTFQALAPLHAWLLEATTA